MRDVRKKARALFARGVEAYRAGRQDDAARHFAEAVHVDPQLADAHHGLGLALLQAGDAETALPHLERATEIDPRNSGFLANLGVALRRLQRHGDARAAYDRAIALDPGSATAFNNRGNASRDLGDEQAALRDYDQALVLMPDYAEAHYNRGVLLQKSGRLDEALAALAEAVRIRPGYADAWNSRGNVLRDLGRWDDAIAEYDRAVATASGVTGGTSPVIAADAYFNRAAVRRDQGDTGGAAKDLRQALALRPDFAQAHWALAFCGLAPVYESAAAMESARRDFPAAVRFLGDAIHANPERSADWEAGVGASQPFYLAYQAVDLRDSLSVCGALACEVMAAWQARAGVAMPGGRRGAGGTERIRVGFVSSQVHRHSVWDVITRGWLTRLDRKRFDVTCYHVGWRRDRETAVARRAAGKFLIGPRSLAAWAGEIAQDRQDVLVYPEIGMEPMTTKLAAMRLAPVQCAAWGHPVTSGLPTMDYFLGGDLLEPVDAERHYTETLVRLPNLGCYFEPLGVRDHGSGPAETRLSRESAGPRFVCCQQVAKYHPAFDDVFVRIALELGRCRFTFVELARTHGAWEKFRARIGRAFAARGLRSDDYCDWLPTLPRAEFLALLARQDIYLDTLSFSGFTTAIQALSCGGLPVVTLDGGFLRNRLAAAILRHIGVADTVAPDVDAYVATAVRLARDRELRTDIRARVIANLARAYRDDSVIRALEAFLQGSIR